MSEPFTGPVADLRATPRRSAAQFLRSARVLRDPFAVGSILWLVLIAVLSFGAALLPLADPLQTDLSQAFQLPSAAHLLGTDSLGRDVLSRLLHGGQEALAGAALAVVVALVLGGTIGVVAGYYGGWVNALASRFADLIFSLPAVVVLLALAAVFGANTAVSMTSFGVLLSASYLRLAQTATLAVRSELYVDAAKVMGLSAPRIIFGHVLTNVAGPLIVQTSLTFGAALLVQAALGFLGLGAPPPAPDWGGMISEASQFIYLQPWLLVPTGIVLSLTILAANLLGDSLRDGNAARRKPSVLARARAAVDAVPDTATEQTSHDAGRLLEVEGLTVSFPGEHGDVDVVSDVSFSVAPGETLALVGESGSGKTMTALAVLGLLPYPGRIRRGAVRFAGSDLARVDEKVLASLRGSDIAMISQEPMVALDPCYTVRSQLTAPLRRHRRLSRSAAADAAARLLVDVGLGEHVDKVLTSYPHQLSGGMAQRAAIAIALAGSPRLLIADEPTTALDVTVQAGILDLLRTLSRSHELAVILVTHDLGVVADIADRAVVMEKGRIVEVQPVLELFAHPREDYTRALIAATPSLLDEETRRS
jgi:peptide/nickel transport system permease protein